MEIISAKNLPLTYKRTGVLWVHKKPHYIVELVQENNVLYAAVFAVHPGTEDKPKKRAKAVVEEKNQFSSQTILGQIAAKLKPSKKVTKWVAESPLFIAPVLPNGVATLTGKREEGFYEREPDRESVQGGVKKIYRGRNTGVFIGLSSIDWDTSMYIPKDSIVKALKDQAEASFYDLEGNNSSQDNPLSTYYKGDNR